MGALESSLEQVEWPCAGEKGYSKGSRRHKSNGQGRDRSLAHHKARYGHSFQGPEPTIKMMNAKEIVSYTFAKPVRMKELDTRLMEVDGAAEGTRTQEPSSCAFAVCLCCLAPRFTYHVSIQGFSRTTRKILLERAAGKDCQIKTSFDKTHLGVNAVAPSNTIKGGSCDMVDWKSSSFTFHSYRLPDELRMSCTFLTEQQQFTGAAFIPVKTVIGKGPKKKTDMFQWFKLIDIESLVATKGVGMKRATTYGAVKVRIVCTHNTIW